MDETCKQEASICAQEEAGKRSAQIEKNLITRLNRIEGQVKGIRAMIERGVYCDDILIQIGAAQAAMSSVAKILLESHMHSCVKERLREGDEAVIDEVMKTIGRLWT